MKLKQLREPKPSKISFRTIRYSKKVKDEISINISEDDERNGIAMFNTMTGESYKENLCMVLLEQEPKVLEYLHQAVPKDINGEFKPLEYKRQDKVIQSWIPDIAIIWEHRSRPMIIEVKPMNYILENEDKLRHKWIETEKYANENNWDFYVFTDAFTANSWRIDNIIDLETQLPFRDVNCEEAILNCYRERNKWTIDALQELPRLNFPKNIILASTFHLIYSNKLFIDFDREFTVFTPITNDPTIYVPLDEWFERYDWKKLLFKQKQEDVISIIDENQLTPQQRKKFNRNKNIVDDFRKGISIEEITDKYKISTRTIYRLWDNSEHGRNLTGLIRKKGSGRKKIRLFMIDEKQKSLFLDKEFEKVIEFYENLEKPNKTQCWHFYKTLKREIAYEKGLISRLNENYRTMMKKCPKGFLVHKDVFFRELNHYIKKFKKRVTLRREGFKQGSKTIRTVISTTPHMNYIG